MRGINQDLRIDLAIELAQLSPLPVSQIKVNISLSIINQNFSAILDKNGILQIAN